MGQYYTPTVLKNDGKYERYNSWDYDSGSKLMEHSYIRNALMNAVSYSIYKCPAKVMWVGDYAKMENLPEGKRTSVLQKKMLYRAWSAHTEDMVRPSMIPIVMDWSKLYLINDTTHEYINMRYYIAESTEICREKGLDNDYVHPLSILTAVGNGLGGGDYEGYNMEAVGVWAGDMISVDDIEPKGYTDVTHDVIFLEAY